MIADIALAIFVICIPGMVHVMFPKRMARMYEKSYRDRVIALGREPGTISLRPWLVFLFGLVWIAVGGWVLANALMTAVQP